MDESCVDIRVYYDRQANTLTIWFGNPQDEQISEETGDEIVLMKDAEGRVIGFEKLNFLAPRAEPLRVAFETLTMW